MRGVGNSFALSRVAPAGCIAFSISRPHFHGTLYRPRNRLDATLTEARDWENRLVGIVDMDRRRKSMSEEGVTA